MNDGCSSTYYNIRIPKKVSNSVSRMVVEWYFMIFSSWLEVSSFSEFIEVAVWGCNGCWVMLGISLGDVFSWTFEWSDEYLLKYGNIMGIVKHILFDGVNVFLMLNIDVATTSQRQWWWGLGWLRWGSENGRRFSCWWISVIDLG